MVRRTGAVEFEDGPAEPSFQILVDTPQDAHLGERIVLEGEMLHMWAPTHRLRCMNLVVLLLLMMVVRTLLSRGSGRFLPPPVLVDHHLVRRRYPPKGHTEIGRRRTKRVNLQLGHPVGRDVGIQLVQDLRDSHGAGVVRQNDGARAVPVQDGGADLRVERARVRRGGETHAKAALEKKGEEIEGQAVRGRVDGLDGAVEEFGEGWQRLLGQRFRAVDFFFMYG